MEETSLTEREIAANEKEMARATEKTEYFVRFSVSQRIEHSVLMVTFVALAVTGLAEKFYTAGWAEWLIGNMGGIAMTRLIHRAFGVMFILSIVYHFSYLIYALGFRRMRLTMLPSMKDIRDIMDSLRYTFGLRDKHIPFGRYDYRQKFEYWGILFGGAIMTLSGLVLVYPVLTTTIFPGQFVAAAREAHGNEAMLAVLTIVIWHLYDVILKPSIFPADLSIFSGKISKKRLAEEHALEYEEIISKPATKTDEKISPLDTEVSNLESPKDGESPKINGQGPF